MGFGHFMGKRARVALVTLAALASLAGIRAIDPPFLQAVRELSFDYYQRLAPRGFQDSPVRVVDIDDASLALYGQWPWPRDRMAEIVNTLNSMGAAAIAFDVIFAEADRSSPRQLALSLPESSIAASPDVKAALKSLPDTDELFAQALAEAPSILGFAILPSATPQQPQLKAGMAHVGPSPASLLAPYASALGAILPLQEAASGVGSVSLSADDTGGIVRRIPLLVTDGTEVFPSLAVEALRVAQGATGLITRADETGKGGALNGIRVGSFSVPVTETGEFWVYYDWNRPERYVSVADLLDPQKRPKVQPLIDGQIIFIGTSAAGLFDIRSTPLGEQVPGVSIHAQAAEQIISGNFLSRPDWAEGAEIIAVLLAGLVLVALLPLTGGLITGAAAVCLTVLMFGGSLLLFVQNGLLIDGLYPSITAFVVFAIGTSMLYVMTDREKRFVRQAFSQYLSPELVSQLEQQPDQLVLGGELRPMTILFMDVRGFTPISEQLTPTELVHFLNTLLSPLSDAIQAHGGTIDKYIGDSIMAFWNAPVRVENHAAMACAASLKMLDVVDQLNAEDAFGFKARNFKTQTVQIGIGLNTGEACVGNMGSSRRFNYSVIGDAVNVASRIESSCKSVGADLVVSEDTRTQAPDLAYLEAGAIPLKGKSRPVKLFALIGDQELRRSEAFRTLELHHMKLMDALDNRKPEAAAAALADCRNAAPPELTAFYDRLAERADQLETAAA